jgi:myosin heavy subunit
MVSVCRELGFEPKELKEVIDTVQLVLHLGNVSFEADQAGGHAKVLPPLLVCSCSSPAMLLLFSLRWVA